MLLELDFLDIETRVDIVNNHSKLQVGESNPPEIISINLSKRAIKKDDSATFHTYTPSYNWDDIKDVLEPVIDYLSSEGFEWRMDRGTLAYNGVPIISTSGSQEFDNIRTKVEMWFLR